MNEKLIGLDFYLRIAVREITNDETRFTYSYIVKKTWLKRDDYVLNDELTPHLLMLCVWLDWNQITRQALFQMMCDQMIDFTLCCTNK